MKAIVGALLLCFASAGVLAADQVWRYVDEKTGVVSYSNVQIKGQKGTKVEIMAYPVSNPSGPAITGPSGAAPQAVPIPPEVLRQLQSPEGAKPSGLPPLPNVIAPSSAKAPLAPTLRSEPVFAPNAVSRKSGTVDVEPKWAKEVQVPVGQSPSWAKDPFEQ